MTTDTVIIRKKATSCATVRQGYLKAHKESTEPDTNFDSDVHAHIAGHLPPHQEEGIDEDGDKKSSQHTRKI